MKVQILILILLIFNTSCKNNYEYQFKDEAGKPIPFMGVQLTTSPENELILKTDKDGFIIIPNDFLKGKPAIFITMDDGHKFWVKVNKKQRILQKTEKLEINQEDEK